jgi:hypothetical protein
MTVPTRQKLHGVHFTPPDLARFLAERLWAHSNFATQQTIRVLDPSCGDGELLEAFLNTVPARRRPLMELVGVESDAASAESAALRLRSLEAAASSVVEGDFLETPRRIGPRLLPWAEDVIPTHLQQSFQVVIANPPYVRTQVLGARRSQNLARRFGLSGRVDLYHPFLIAATESLAAGGLLGVITSNRFLYTQAGASVRAYLARSYEVLEVLDLGDTKLFEAAVLPAIFIGRKVDGPKSRVARARFARVYGESSGEQRNAPPGEEHSVIDVLSGGKCGVFQTPAGRFRVVSGEFQLPSRSDVPWTMQHREETAWLHAVQEKSVCRIGDIAAVRVGIKTTADRVFIRSDWDELPSKTRPEPELLRPVLTHLNANRWLPQPGPEPHLRVLYPHEVAHGRRQPVDLRHYPRARAYLEAHRTELEKRKYLIDAGRRWYEIWVPQDPALWSAPKVVCPDISPEPRFYFDDRRMIVDGDSYWITTLPTAPVEWLYVILAVANSRLMAAYHDLAFPNRLYSGRRRYLTQHVTQYPLPKLDHPTTQRIITLVRDFLLKVSHTDGDRQRLQTETDNLVDAAFETPSLAQHLELL